jgi:hypothetical protein
MRGRVAVLTSYAGDLGLNATAVARDLGADHTLSLDELPKPEQRIDAVKELTDVFSCDATTLVRGNMRLVATSNYAPWALAQALAFLGRNLKRFPFERLISPVFPLAKISEAFRQAEWRGRAAPGVSRAAISMGA